MPRQLQLSLNYTQRASNVCPPFWGYLTRNKESRVNQLEIPRRVFDDRFTLKRCGARYSSSSCHQEELAQLKKIIGPNLIILSTLRDVKNQGTNQWRQSRPQISGLQGALAPSIWNKEISGNSHWVVSLRAVLSSLEKNQYLLVTVRSYIEWGKWSKTRNMSNNSISSLGEINVIGKGLSIN